MDARDAPEPDNARDAARGLNDLPDDELARYGRELGLDLPRHAERGELLRRVRERQELLLRLDRDAMLDVVVWARRPVRRSASKEELAREIAAVQRTNYETLSRRGLFVLATLRSLPAADADGQQTLVRRLRHADGFWKRLLAPRRAALGAVLSTLIEGAPAQTDSAYQFLPEHEASRRVPLKHEIEDRGIVGGIASRLRGVADDYVREKLDEIEARIDRKLDEIDARLSEWRDREVANRLKIIRITLIASVLFAIVSLGYHYLRRAGTLP